MAATDARPVPLKGTAYRVTFPMMDAAGDLVSEVVDAVISRDGADYEPTLNTPVDIEPNSGTYYLDLTDEEMNANTVAIIATATDAKPQLIVLYPIATDSTIQIISIGGM